MPAQHRTPGVISVLFTLLAAGCVPSPTLRPLATAVRAGAQSEQVIVLFKITARIGTDTVHPPPYQLELLDLATGESESAHVFSPSRKLRDEGWAYLLVHPGLYRLTAVLLFFGYPSRSFELAVNAADTIVYVGSLSTHCRRESVLLYTLITDCSSLTVTSEAPAGEMFGLGSMPFSTRPLRTLDRLEGESTVAPSP